MLRYPLAVLASLLLASCGLPMPFAASDAAPLGAKAYEPLDPKFFARIDVLKLHPQAFSVMPESTPVIRAIPAESEPKRQALIQAIKAESSLHQKIRSYGTLSQDQQLAVLKRVFEVETRVLGITPPELAFDPSLKGPAYFDFDPARPGTGRVILNPAEIAKESNPYAGLLLLMHETRHSAQFQMAFAPLNTTMPAVGYKAAFEAQKALSKQLNFTEFCSLHNEYEAFQFANYVVGALTDWKVDTLDMGCFSSQYDAQGKLKIDLVALSHQTGAYGLVSMFNKLEKEQYRLLYAKP